MSTPEFLQWQWDRVVVVCAEEAAYWHRNVLPTGWGMPYPAWETSTELAGKEKS